MKATGIVRKVDEFGRIVIPVELRRQLNVELKDTIEFVVKGKNVILRKATLGCSHCGGSGTIFTLGNIKLCQVCRDFYTGFALGYFSVERGDSSSVAKKRGQERAL